MNKVKEWLKQWIKKDTDKKNKTKSWLEEWVSSKK